VKQEWYDMTLDLYRTKVALKPGALEFLQQMKEAKIPVGIASSNTKGLIEAVLEALDIRSYFTSIRTSCEVRAGKPAPDVYLKVAEDLQVDPTHCLVFEDVINGILAGKNAKMCVCAVDDSFSKTDESRKRELADFFIHDYYEILNGTYHVGGLQTEGKEE
jgi:16S rRNA pseudouridine516 synthase